MEDIDTILGTWTYESSENDEAFGPAAGYPKGMLERINTKGTTHSYEKLGDGRYKLIFICDVTGRNESEFALNQKITNKMLLDGNELEVSLDVKYEGNGLWKEIQTHPGNHIVEETKQVSGDKMTVTYTCNGVSGSAVYTRI